MNGPLSEGNFLSYKFASTKLIFKLLNKNTVSIN